MPLRTLTPRLSFHRAGSLSAFLLAIAILSAPRATAAQKLRLPVVQGHITAIHLPTSIDVNHRHVLLNAKTLYYQAKDNFSNPTHTLSNPIRTGDYLFVFGPVHPHTHSITAHKILLGNPNWRNSLSGIGVIQRVISTGRQPVFESDGYRIRITPTTAVKYSGKLKSLADITTNVWLKYKGTLDGTGTLVATRARFIAPKLSRLKHKRPGLRNGSKGRKSNATPTRQKAGYAKGSLINANGKIVAPHTKVRYSHSGGWCGWQKLVANQALQQRVTRIGMSVVPAYQKELPPDNRSKISFRFIVVDQTRIRSELVCNSKGIIFVPKAVVNRLKNNDRLAAVLADGVALDLQIQWAKLAVDERLSVGAEVAQDAAFIANPLPVSLGTALVNSVFTLRYARLLQAQRDRMALALMADAGYNPWQAPEAWRLLKPRHLPKNLRKLKYPARSQYQFQVLNLEYRKAAPGQTNTIGG